MLLNIFHLRSTATFVYNHRPHQECAWLLLPVLQCFFSSAAFLCTQKTKPPIFFKLAYLVCDVNIFSTFSVHLINSSCFCAESGIEWFQRKVPHRLTDAAESATIKAQKGILPIDGQFRKLVTKSNREPRLKGGYFFVWFMYAIKIETMIPRIIRTTVSSS